MDKGETWLKLYRSMLDWEWYGDPVTKIVFLHLLLIVNTAPQRRRGILVPAGAIDITQQQLAQQSNLSIMQVRRAIRNLQNTSEITVSRHHDFSVISIVRWDDYQSRQQSKQQSINSQSTVRQQSINQLNKNNKEYIEWKEYKEPDGLSDFEKEFGVDAEMPYKEVAAWEKEHSRKWEGYVSYE